MSDLLLNLLNKADVITQQYIFAGYQRMADVYAPSIYLMIGLSVILFGYAVANGWVALSLPEASKRLLGMGLVVLFALNWGTFSSYVYALFVDAPNEIANTLIQAIPGGAYHDGSTINTALEQAWYSGWDLSASLWKMGGISNLFPLVWGFVTILTTVIMVGIAFIEIIGAKFGLSIFMVLTPLVLPLSLFSVTKGIVERWFNSLVTFAFIPLFVINALALGLTLLSDSTVDIQTAMTNHTLTIAQAAPYVIYTIVVSGLLLKAAHMASHMASGLSMALIGHVTNATSQTAKHTSRLAMETARQIYKRLPLNRPAAPSSTNTLPEVKNP